MLIKMEKGIDEETKKECDEFVDDMILKEEYKMEKEKEIEVKTFYDKKTKENLGVELPDGTIILVDKKEKGLGMFFPKKKFLEMFKKQDKEGRKYLGVVFSEDELEIMSKTIGEINGNH